MAERDGKGAFALVVVFNMIERSDDVRLHEGTRGVKSGVSAPVLLAPFDSIHDWRRCSSKSLSWKRHSE